MNDKIIWAGSVQYCGTNFNYRVIQSEEISAIQMEAQTPEGRRYWTTVKDDSIRAQVYFTAFLEQKKIAEKNAEMVKTLILQR